MAVLIPENTDLDLTGITPEIPQSITSLLIWGADIEGNPTNTKPSIKTKGFNFNGTLGTVESSTIYIYIPMVLLETI